MDIGIDLGTTFSVLAVTGRVDLAPDYPPATYLDECDVTVIPTPYGEPTFPSVVVEDPEHAGSYLFGSDALQKLEEGHAPVMFSKRKIGTLEEIPLGERKVLAREVSRELLRHFKACAERALGQPVVRAVVTHPAYFDRAAVEETRQAAVEAGFDMSLPEQMLMEPVAAALTYTRTDRRDPLHVLTYDLGGGTFDVTYLVRRSGIIDMRAFDGDHLMGGYNFDRELVHWVRQRLAEKGRTIRIDEEDPDDRARLARLLRVAEQVKVTLARAPSETTMVDFRARGILRGASGGDVQINERISRQQFVELIAHHLERAVECCRRALAKGGVAAADLDEVLLVGGSTYGPWVCESVRKAFPETRPKLFHPDLCVGAGAAIHARLVLPALVPAASCRLVLEAPEKAVLDTVNVAGRVVWTGAAPASMQAVLRTAHRPADNRSVPLAADGRFLFEDVELLEGPPNAFSLAIIGDDGAAAVEHGFSISYAPETSEASAVSTVLPKPLFIETLNGLVPLAQEGVPLPAQCEQTFVRENDNPNISLKLYQERRPIGEVRVEGIPAAGGRGALVHLKVNVTDKNEICGTATIEGRDGRTVMTAPVRIAFDVADVASAGALQAAYLELQLRVAMSVSGWPEEKSASVLQQLQRIGTLFEQQPLERQEVEVALRRLQELLVPPADDMHPTRAEFESIVAQCRGRIAEIEQIANAVLEASPSGREQGPELASASRNLEKAKRARPLVDRLEVEGLEAHGQRARKEWARVHDAITDVQAALREKQEPREVPPTPMGKAFAAMSILRMKAQIESRAREFHAERRLGDWMDELNRISRGLDAALREVNEVENDLPPEQGRAQIARIFARTLNPLEDAIKRLGIDVSLHGSPQA